jgi:DNA-binding NarL/FixJ family response regulator
MKTAVMLVEDSPEYRDVVEIAIKKDPNLELAGKFGAAEIALRSLQDLTSDRAPDIVLLDLNLPGMSGLDSIPWFKKYAPKTKIIILSQSDKKEDILQAIRHGAAGYLLKSSTISQIKEGIHSVMAGDNPLDAGVAKHIINNLKVQPAQDATRQALSDREFEILSMLAEGLVKKEIGDLLHIGYGTVATHIRHIYEKLSVTNAPAAVHKAHRLGLFPSDK